MTTPTPDQGALERAHDLWRDLCEKDDRTSPEEYPDMALITEDEFVYCMTAAASEARAAERERCEQIVQNYIDRPTSGPKNNTLSAFEQGMDHMAGCIDNASAILDAIRALATPAQSET